jgi:hypothetical protein
MAAGAEMERKRFPWLQAVELAAFNSWQVVVRGTDAHAAAPLHPFPEKRLATGAVHVTPVASPQVHVEQVTPPQTGLCPPTSTWEVLLGHETVPVLW